MRATSGSTVHGRAGHRRLLGVTALGCAVAAVTVVVLGSGDPYTLTARFASAGQLVEGNQVRTGAATVGTVERIRLDPDGVAVIDLDIDEDLAPLPRGTTARIRIASLGGVANRFVSLDIPPAPEHGRAPTIPDGSTLPTTKTDAPVDLDALLDALDPPTRAGLRALVRGGAEHYDGRTKQARAALQQLEPALLGVTGVARELGRDEAAFSTLLAEGAKTVGALASRRQDLTDLVTHAETTAAAVARESDALRRAFAALPSALDGASTTFAQVRTTLDALDPLVATALPATRDLAPFLTDLRALTTTAAAPVGRLRALTSDLTELSTGATRLAPLVRTAFPRAARTLDRASGQVATLREYTPDLVATLARLGQVSAGYDANGHYARVQPAFFGLRYDAATGKLEADDRDRLARLQNGVAGRCPGGAGVLPTDGSGPWPVGACRLSTTPPVR